MDYDNLANTQKDQKCIDFFLTIAESTRKPLTRHLLSEKFRQYQPHSLSNTYLYYRFPKMVEILTKSRSYTNDQKAKFVFLISAELTVELLDQLKTTAHIMVNEYNQLIKYESFDGNTKLEGVHKKPSKKSIDSVRRKSSVVNSCPKPGETPNVMQEEKDGGILKNMKQEENPVLAEHDPSMNWAPAPFPDAIATTSGAGPVVVEANPHDFGQLHFPNFQTTQFGQALNGQLTNRALRREDSSSTMATADQPSPNYYAQFLKAVNHFLFEILGTSLPGLSSAVKLARDVGYEMRIKQESLKAYFIVYLNKLCKQKLTHEMPEESKSFYLKEVLEELIEQIKPLSEPLKTELVDLVTHRFHNSQSSDIVSKEIILEVFGEMVNELEQNTNFGFI